MALDSHYITSVDLESYLVDRDTGAPLAFGTIEFYQDDSRLTPKIVYQLTGAPVNYTYDPLPNPITLSSVGTVSDDSGVNTPIYYKPYDDAGNVQLYYIVVKNSLGVVQFTREAWPNTISASPVPVGSSDSFTNTLMNSQFVDIAFSSPLTVTFPGAQTTTTTLGSNWTLVTTSSGAGTVVVTRTNIAGSLAYPGNPPFTLTVAPGTNVTGLELRQRLNNDPDIFSPSILGATNGYISASIMLAPLTNLTMGYRPNGQVNQVILTQNNLTGSYAEFNNTIQLTPATNPSTGDTGYVDIVLTLPTASVSTFSNVQIVGLNSNVMNVPYIQVPANTQLALIGGSNANTAAATGTSGQVYTANGPGIAPTFQALPLPAVTHISSITAANSASLEFKGVFSSAYSQYLFTFVNVLPATNNVILYAVLGTGAGPSYVVTNYNWQHASTVNTSTVNTSNATDTQFVITQLGGTYGIAGAGNGVCGSLTIYGTNGSSSIATGIGTSTYIEQSVGYSIIGLSSFTQPAAIFTSIKFYMSSGNIASGTINIYASV